MNETSAQAGLVVGPYRLVARLGAGAMGEVWRALDTRLDRQVALKLLPPSLATDPDRRARMLREARAAAAVPHPNVVTLFDIVSEHDQDYLVMEYVEGTTIADRLRAGPVPLREALDIGIGVVDALAAAHRKGILHRDVKAANVMLTTAGEVKVLDFGLAKLRGRSEAVAAVVAMPLSLPTGLAETLVSDSGAQTSPSGVLETREGTLLGTPAYFSPEQVHGKLPDEKSEIFTTGVLLYELATGVSPFAAERMEDLFRKILECKPPPPDVPEPMAAVLAQALAAEPRDRYADMAALGTALRGVREILFAPPKRARWPWVTGAAVVAAAAAGLIAWRVFRSEPLSPADRYLQQALGEYDVYHNAAATQSLHAAMRVAPDDPRPYAYLVLMQVAQDDDRRAAAREAQERVGGARRPRDRALVAAAAALVTSGPAEARAFLHSQRQDPELRFWDSELAWQAGAFDDAAAGYKLLYEQPTRRFRGRLLDHYGSYLLFRNRIPEAVAVAEAYAQLYPGEADAVGAEATAYAAAGRLDEALRLANDAVAMAPDEDTLSGLAKVHALRGELGEAERLYKRAIANISGTEDHNRLPLRRASLAMVLLLNGRTTDAHAVVAPCLPGGEDAEARTVSICLLVAGLVDDTKIPEIIPLLEKRALMAVPYGRPGALARILKARLALGTLTEPAPPESQRAVEDLLVDADDLFASYHLPFFASYVERLRAEVAIRAAAPLHAVQILEGAVRAHPADVAALFLLARAQMQAGAKAEAVDTLDRLQETWKTADPDSVIQTNAGKLRQNLYKL